MSLTHESTGSFAIHDLMCAAVVGDASSASMSSTVSVGSGTMVGVSGSGKRLRRSAFPLSTPALN